MSFRQVSGWVTDQLSSAEGESWRRGSGDAERSCRTRRLVRSLRRRFFPRREPRPVLCGARIALSGSGHRDVHILRIMREFRARARSHLQHLAVPPDAEVARDNLIMAAALVWVGRIS